MTVQLSVAVRNGMLNGLVAAIGASPILTIYAGAPPASTSAAQSGTVLATIQLPATWAAVANGVLTKVGTWEDLAADATGTAGGYRISASDGSTGHMQGTVAKTGDPGDMNLDSLSFTAGQKFTVTQFTQTQPGA